MDAAEPSPSCIGNEAYKFGLKIQKYVEKQDLQSLFGLVDGELKIGPRNKFIQGKSFSEIFTSEWREDVLSQNPPCKPYRGWDFYHMGNISYKKYGKWIITSIHGEILEDSKKPLYGGWKHNGKLLTRNCFTIIWRSGDNEDEYYQKPIRLSDCLQNKVGSTYFDDMLLKELTIEEGWVVSDYCFADSPDICLNFKYGLFKKISPSLCRFFTENCVEAGLVQIIDESDGSIGNDIREVIYGIINDPLTNEVYVLPLLTFDYLNEALNFIDE